MDNNLNFNKFINYIFNIEDIKDFLDKKNNIVKNITNITNITTFSDYLKNILFYQFKSYNETINNNLDSEFYFNDYIFDFDFNNNSSEIQENIFVFKNSNIFNLNNKETLNNTYNNNNAYFTTNTLITKIIDIIKDNSINTKIININEILTENETENIFIKLYNKDENDKYIKNEIFISKLNEIIIRSNSNILTEDGYNELYNEIMLFHLTKEQLKNNYIKTKLYEDIKNFNDLTNDNIINFINENYKLLYNKYNNIDNNNNKDNIDINVYNININEYNINRFKVFKYKLINGLIDDKLNFFEYIFFYNEKWDTYYKDFKKIYDIEFNNYDKIKNFNRILKNYFINNSLTTIEEYTKLFEKLFELEVVDEKIKKLKNIQQKIDIKNDIKNDIKKNPNGININSTNNFEIIKNEIINKINNDSSPITINENVNLSYLQTIDEKNNLTFSNFINEIIPYDINKEYIIKTFDTINENINDTDKLIYNDSYETNKLKIKKKIDDLKNDEYIKFKFNMLTELYNNNNNNNEQIKNSIDTELNKISKINSDNLNKRIEKFNEIIKSNSNSDILKLSVLNYDDDLYDDKILNGIIISNIHNSKNKTNFKELKIQNDKYNSYNKILNNYTKYTLKYEIYDYLKNLGPIEINEIINNIKKFNNNIYLDYLLNINISTSNTNINFKDYIGFIFNTNDKIQNKYYKFLEKISTIEYDDNLLKDIYKSVIDPTEIINYFTFNNFSLNLITNLKDLISKLNNYNIYNFFSLLLSDTNIFEFNKLFKDYYINHKDSDYKSDILNIINNLNISDIPTFKEYTNTILQLNDFKIEEGYFYNDNSIYTKSGFINNYLNFEKEKLNDMYKNYLYDNIKLFDQKSNKLYEIENKDEYNLILIDKVINEYLDIKENQDDIFQINTIKNNFNNLTIENQKKLLKNMKKYKSIDEEYNINKYNLKKYNFYKNEKDYINKNYQYNRLQKNIFLTYLKNLLPIDSINIINAKLEQYKNNIEFANNILIESLEYTDEIPSNDTDLKTDNKDEKNLQNNVNDIINSKNSQKGGDIIEINKPLIENLTYKLKKKMNIYNTELFLYIAGILSDIKSYNNLVKNNIINYDFYKNYFINISEYNELNKYIAKFDPNFNNKRLRDTIIVNFYADIRYSNQFIFIYTYLDNIINLVSIKEYFIDLFNNNIAINELKNVMIITNNILDNFKNENELYNYFNLYDNISTIKNIYLKMVKDRKKVFTYIKVRCDTDKENPRYNIKYNKDTGYIYLDYHNFSNNIDTDIKKITNTEKYNNYTNEKYYFGPFDNYYSKDKSNEDIANDYGGDKNILKSEGMGNKILDKIINKKEDVCIIGYGQSGSGKTSALIYLKYTKGNKDIIQKGIIEEICNRQAFIDNYKNLNINVYNLYTKFGSKCSDMNDYKEKDYDEQFINNHNNDIDAQNDNTNAKNYNKENNINEQTNDKNAQNDNNNKFVYNPEKKGWYTQNGNNNENNTQNNKDNMNLGEYITFYMNKRQTEPTPNNPNSSRSHVIINIKCINNDNSEQNIVVCDLAGVENQFNCDDINEILKFNDRYLLSDKYKNNKNINLDRYDCDLKNVVRDTNDLISNYNNYTNDYINNGNKCIEKGPEIQNIDLNEHFSKLIKILKYYYSFDDIFNFLNYRIYGKENNLLFNNDNLDINKYVNDVILIKIKNHLEYLINKESSTSNDILSISNDIITKINDDITKDITILNKNELDEIKNLDDIKNLKEINNLEDIKNLKEINQLKNIKITYDNNLYDNFNNDYFINEKFEIINYNNDENLIFLNDKLNKNNEKNLSDFKKEEINNDLYKKMNQRLELLISINNVNCFFSKKIELYNYQIEFCINIIIGLLQSIINKLNININLSNIEFLNEENIKKYKVKLNKNNKLEIELINTNLNELFNKEKLKELFKEDNFINLFNENNFNKLFNEENFKNLFNEDNLKKIFNDNNLFNKNNFNKLFNDEFFKKEYNNYYHNCIDVCINNLIKYVNNDYNSYHNLYYLSFINTLNDLKINKDDNKNDNNNDDDNNISLFKKLNQDYDSLKTEFNKITNDNLNLNLKRLKILYYNCKLRRHEGFMINRSLLDIRTDIKELVITSLKDEGKFEPLFFEKEVYSYCRNINLYDDNFEPFYNIISKTKSQRQLSNIIKKNCDVMNLNYIIFNVINLTYNEKVNNPPNPPYINVNDLYYSIYYMNKEIKKYYSKNLYDDLFNKLIDVYNFLYIKEDINKEKFINETLFYLQQKLKKQPLQIKLINLVNLTFNKNKYNEYKYKNEITNLYNEINKEIENIKTKNKKNNDDDNYNLKNDNINLNTGEIDEIDEIDEKTENNLNDEINSLHEKIKQIYTYKQVNDEKVEIDNELINIVLNEINSINSLTQFYNTLHSINELINVNKYIFIKNKINQKQIELYENLIKDKNFDFFNSNIEKIRNQIKENLNLNISKSNLELYDSIIKKIEKNNNNFDEKSNNNNKKNNNNNEKNIFEDEIHKLENEKEIFENEIKLLENDDLEKDKDDLKNKKIKSNEHKLKVINKNIKEIDNLINLLTIYNNNNSNTNIDYSKNHLLNIINIIKNSLLITPMTNVKSYSKYSDEELKADLLSSLNKLKEKLKGDSFYKLDYDNILNVNLEDQTYDTLIYKGKQLLDIIKINNASTLIGSIDSTDVIQNTIFDKITCSYEDKRNNLLKEIGYLKNELNPNNVINTKNEKNNSLYNKLDNSLNEKIKKKYFN